MIERRVCCIVVLGLVGLLAGCDALADESDLASCERSSECVLAPKTCCGVCGDPITLEDVEPINDGASQAHFDMVCGPNTGCPAILCVQFSPTLVATCEAGACAAVELPEHESTRCSSDADCRIRTIECCECGGRTDKAGLVAISDEASFAELVCEPDMPCDECGPRYPPEAVAACELGRCVVDDTRMF